MSRRTLSGIVACVLLVALFAVASLMPVPYVTFSPGPTVDVLAENKGEEIVQINGEKTYRQDGEIRLTTVSVTSPQQELGLLDAMFAWIDGDRAVYPRDAIYDPEQSVADVRQQSSVQMVSSQDTAIAVALSELGYELPMVVEVYAVTKGGPAEGELKVRDQVVSVNGTPITGSASVSKAVQRTEPGEKATFVVRRDGQKQTVQVRTEAAEDDPSRSMVGIVIGPGYDFPFDVRVNIDDNIGGPSAGLIFSLAVYDTLTPGSLTGGRPIAGTGTIDEDGTVGPIGGIQQKIVGAERTGAELFLVPPGNCAEALGAPIEEGEIRLVKAPTMHSAVESLQAWAEDQDAELPQCG